MVDAGAVTSLLGLLTHENTVGGKPLEHGQHAVLWIVVVSTNGVLEVTVAMCTDGSVARRSSTLLSLYEGALGSVRLVMILSADVCVVMRRPEFSVGQGWVVDIGVEPLAVVRSQPRQDISISVLLLLQELTDSDVLSETEEASVIIDAIVHKQVLALA